MMESPDRSTAPVPAVERRATVDGVELVLRVDPVALEALDAARRAGGSPSEYGALPSPDELPLMLVVLEMRIAGVERELRELRDLING